MSSIPTLRFFTMLLCLWGLFAAPAQAFNIDDGFNPDVNDRVIALAQQADGKVLIGGYFTSVNATARNRIARLNADGTLDASFDPGAGANGIVNTLAQQADGKILIGGNFTTVNGTARNRIARLNADGTLDMSFDPGDGANKTVYALAQQADGKVLIGGFFTLVNGTARHRIARLNADGTLDMSFDPGSGANNTVNALAQQANGKILIGGWFFTVDGTARSYIARLNADGTLDTSFDPGTGANNIVHALAQQTDGKVLIGGVFTTVDGTARNRIARLNADGSLDTSFDPGTGANGSVNALAQQADGKVLIGGGFTSVNGTGCNHIARLNADGSLDMDFDPGSGASDYVNALAQQADGKVLIGGSFTSVNGIVRNRIARLNVDGTLDMGFFAPDFGANGGVHALAQQADGKVLIGGQFTSVNGTERNRIARLNADGALDMGFDPGSGANNWVRTLAQQADGKILIGGDFTRVNGMVRNRIARLNADGTPDTDFDPGSGADNPVAALAQQADGKVLIGGYFTSVNGTARNRIARLNADGALDASFDPGSGASSYVYALAQQADGKVLIGGNFTSVNGIARHRIARLNADGSLDTNFAPGTGANNVVAALTQQTDGKILIGGWFSTVNGTARNRIARFSITEAALQSAAAAGNGKSVTWLRGGASPVLSWATVEISTDGLTWGGLVNGVRARTAGDDWTFTGLSLPYDAIRYLRLRGYRGTSVYASGSIAEVIQQVYLTKANDCSFFVIPDKNGHAAIICL